MKRSWAIALIVLWIAMSVATNVALATHGTPAPEIPLDHLVDAFV